MTTRADANVPRRALKEGVLFSRPRCSLSLSPSLIPCGRERAFSVLSSRDRDKRRQRPPEKSTRICFSLARPLWLAFRKINLASYSAGFHVFARFLQRAIPSIRRLNMCTRLGRDKFADPFVRHEIVILPDT